MFHPKQLMVISAGDDADIRVWDLITKSCAATLKVQPVTPPAALPVLHAALLHVQRIHISWS